MLGISTLSFSTQGGRRGSYGGLVDAGDSIASYNFSVDDYFFFGFQGRVDRNSQAQQTNNASEHLLALGIVSYHYLCLRDEKSRQGADFVWGSENDATTSSSLVDAITGSVTDQTVNVESNLESVNDSRDYSFFDDATDTELYIGYITFGLNVIFLIMLIIWITNKFCCENRDKSIMDYLNFLKRQN